ncbi:endonuclease domain-containing protein [Micropruina sonneratiae]|uniref:endonuclease domain-containing protein n=1 Tax=Micropruina sonneratiae TaxID=2986940 RepID=UPI0022268287|nr:endonuclease domain-containing protein [Micropruina sp. KQZ13P-5]MCW3159222.1 endonuclease domain-containing protein [Micropruina sp. KQZ13P-5]
MDRTDDLITLTTVMERNNGVLRQRDHGASRAAFDRLVRSGAIVRVLPGTFVDATLLTNRQTRCAAALATYPASVLWGADAVAALAGTLTGVPFGPRDRVLLAHAQSRYAASSVSWVRRRIPATHRVRVSGLRCPSAAYLAVEAAARDSGDLIERFLREGRVTPDELPAILSLLAGTPGQEVRRRIVRTSLDNPWSGGERLLQATLRRSRITGWVANAALDGVTLHPDVYVEQARLVLEFDGYGVHSKAEVFEADRRRQNALVLGGYRVLRYTWKQLTEHPETLIDQVRAMLAREITSDSPAPAGG